MKPGYRLWQGLVRLAAAALLLAGCTGPAVTPHPGSDSRNRVEVFSWWTGGGEAAGLAAMIRLFQQQYPDIEFINAAVAGGAGTNARSVLATRLQADNPPDSWQAHAGQEIIGTYVTANQVEALNFLYEREGWLEVMPESLIPLISQDGKIYSVPVNIHRSNVLWYNPRVLQAHGIDPTDLVTLDDFIAALDQLKADGMTPLALGEQWTAMHLMETVLLSVLGPGRYNAVWTGDMGWDDPLVTRALEKFGKILEYANSDASSLTWQDAAQLVVNGDAAFNIMGDWVEGYYKELKKVPRVDFGWMQVPGTRGAFQFLSDSFTLSANAPHREAAIDWLTILGSREGQDAFNPLKGSIPARKDADRSLYDEYLQSAMDDWSTDVIVGSLAHGVVANDSWKTLINDALGSFLATHDVQRFQAGLLAACRNSGPCP